MKIKCKDCGVETRGRYEKLLKYGWHIVHINDKIKLCKCSYCKLNKEKLQQDVEEAVRKMLILHSLSENRETATRYNEWGLFN